jgi:hypothetical protein
MTQITQEQAQALYRAACHTLASIKVNEIALPFCEQMLTNAIGSIDKERLAEVVGEAGQFESIKRILGIAVGEFPGATMEVAYSD